jgi:hypothetical protein
MKKEKKTFIFKLKEEKKHFCIDFKGLDISSLLKKLYDHGLIEEIDTSIFPEKINGFINMDPGSQDKEEELVIDIFSRTPATEKMIAKYVEGKTTQEKIINDLFSNHPISIDTTNDDLFVFGITIQLPSKHVKKSTEEIILSF